MNSPPLAVIVLAAGKGTRMRSALPKVLHKVAGRSMVGHVIAAAEALGAERVVVVVAPGMDDVSAAVKPHATAVQHSQNGTADAVKAARAALAGFAGDVLILYGDCPLVQADTLARADVADYGLTNALVGMGVAEHDARSYEREFAACRTVVTVQTVDRLSEAAQILRRNRARAVHRW